MGPIVPPTLSLPLLRLCAELSAGVRPVRIAVVPVEGAIRQEPFANVERQVGLAGGEACRGWRIWEHPGDCLEAEFHVVWRTPSGRLREITPYDGALEAIVFLADPTRAFAGLPPESVRRSLASGST